LLGNYSLFFIRFREKLVFFKATVDGQGDSPVFVIGDECFLLVLERLESAGEDTAIIARPTTSKARTVCGRIFHHLRLTHLGLSEIKRVMLKR